jgi:acyl-coenzyme A synthetase/AMP-(fatty) acid ligase
MVSGSSSLPKTTLNSWVEITGHVLLERYGMTEIGMGLTQALDPNERVPVSMSFERCTFNISIRKGTVGHPFPGVEARIVDEDTKELILEDDQAGELQIKGPSVFKESDLLYSIYANPNKTVGIMANQRRQGTHLLMMDGIHEVLSVSGCNAILGSRRGTLLATMVLRNWSRFWEEEAQIS